MELRHLRYFVAVAEELHFGRAARRLNIAQPPLSQQIQALEREIGVQLFRRTSRRVGLTEEGRAFLDQARATLRQAERAVETARRVSRGQAGRIVIGFVASAVYGPLPAILREFHRRLPAVEISCQEMVLTRQVEALLAGEIDVSMLRTPVQAEGIEARTILRESLVLAVDETHPAAARAGKRVRLAEFASSPFIFFPRAIGPTLHDLMWQACIAAGFTPHIGHEANEMQTILALVASGLGVALVPASLRNLKRPGVAYLDLSPSVPTELALAWRREHPSPLVTSLVSIAGEIFGA